MSSVEFLFNQMEQSQYYIGNDLYAALKEAEEMEILSAKVYAAYCIRQKESGQISIPYERFIKR